MFHLSRNQITTKTLVEFLQNQQPESEIIEYKSDLDEGPNIAKTISAFANTYGGLLILGVKTNNENKPIIPACGMPLKRDLDLTISEIGLKSIFPPYPPEIIRILPLPEDESRCVVVVRVFPSEFAPHAIKNNTEVYFRVGAHNYPPNKTDRKKDFFRPAQVSELEFLQERRKKSISLREEMITRARDRFSRINQNITGVTFEAFYTPLYPIKPLIRIEELEQCLSQDSGIGTGLNLITDFYDTVSIPGGLGLFKKASDSLLPYYAEFNQFGLAAIIWAVEKHAKSPSERRLVAVDFRDFATIAFEHWQFSINYLKNVGYQGPGFLHWRASGVEGVEFGTISKNDHYFRSFSTCKDPSFEVYKNFVWTGCELDNNFLDEMFVDFAWKAGAYRQGMFKKDEFLGVFRTVVKQKNAKNQSPTR